MTLAHLKSFLLWSALVNYGVLLLWFGTFRFAHDWLYRAHTRWYRITPEQFDLFNYGGIGLYKILVLVFNLVPLAVLFVIA